MKKLQKIINFYDRYFDETGMVTSDEIIDKKIMDRRRSNQFYCNCFEEIEGDEEYFEKIRNERIKIVKGIFPYKDGVRIEFLD